jgi:hypothetical protein
MDEIVEPNGSSNPAGLPFNPLPSMRMTSGLAS